MCESECMCVPCTKHSALPLRLDPWVTSNLCRTGEGCPGRARGCGWMRPTGPGQCSENPALRLSLPTCAPGSQGQHVTPPQGAGVRGAGALAGGQCLYQRLLHHAEEALLQHPRATQAHFPLGPVCSLPGWEGWSTQPRAALMTRAQWPSRGLAPDRSGARSPATCSSDPTCRLGSRGLWLSHQPYHLPLALPPLRRVHIRKSWVRFRDRPESIAHGL